jgi:hypothetical protein
MNLELIKENSIVEKDGRYMPVIFLDLPSGICAAATATAAKQLGNQISEQRKKSFVTPFINNIKYVTLQPLCASPQRIESMRESIDDIVSF